MKYLTILLLLIPLKLLAPAIEATWIERPMPDNYYDRLFKAVVMTESGGNIYAYNAEERACGPCQIRPIRIAHFNRLTGKDYRTWDVFDLSVSREIFMYFTRGRDYETVSKEWNGSGPKTIEYWDKIRRVL